MAYKSILVIDDDLDDQEIFLSAMGVVSDKIDCLTLCSGIEALSKLRKREIVTDLIFLDLNMPIMTGQQFLTELKEQDELCDIPVIVLSTTSYQPTIDQTLSLGATDFITKPDKFDELVGILNRIFK